MLLASRIINADPAPHRCLLCQERFAQPQTRATTSHVTKRVRRDKFVIPTAHAANTILNDFRATFTGDTAVLVGRVMGELHAVRRGDRARHGAGAVAHADLVLTRYLRLSRPTGFDTIRA